MLFTFFPKKVKGTNNELTIIMSARNHPSLITWKATLASRVSCLLHVPLQMTHLR